MNGDYLPIILFRISRLQKMDNANFHRTEADAKHPERRFGASRAPKPAFGVASIRRAALHGGGLPGFWNFIHLDRDATPI